MQKCVLCGKQFHSDVPYVLFTSVKNGVEFHACEACEKQMRTLVESSSSNEIKEAINYLYTCLDDIEDEEVKDFVQCCIDSDAPAVEETYKQEKKQLPVQEKKRDYFAEKAASNTDRSFWVSVLYISGIIAFALIIIGGLITGIGMLSYSATGLLVILGSIIGAFVAVSGIMVLVEIADGINYIKKNLKK